MITSSVMEMKVPDLGVSGSLRVSQIHVKPGDVITQQCSIVTLESDKSSIDLPSSGNGTVKEVKVKEGDGVSVGCCLLTFVPIAKMSSERKVGASQEDVCEVAVIGCGPGGSAAALQAASLGLKVIVIESSNIGGVCLNEGCIPSKSLLHLSSSISECLSLRHSGVNFYYPHIRIDRMRQRQREIINCLSEGLRKTLSCAKVKLIRGSAAFLSTKELEIKGSERKELKFKYAIIATGSLSAPLKEAKISDRIVFSAQALSLERIPNKMLIVGAGIIGLELATIYSMFGTVIDIVETKCKLNIMDEDLMLFWQRQNDILFRAIMFSHNVHSIEDEGRHVKVIMVDGGVQKKERYYDLVLICVGRQPNSQSLKLENADVKVNGAGFIQVDAQMRTNVPNIMAVGDVAGGPMLAHKAIYQGRTAAEALVNAAAIFQPLQIPTVMYTNPEIAWTGFNESECLERNIPFLTKNLCWSFSGRAVAQNFHGTTKLLFHRTTGKLIGGGMAGKNASELINEIGIAIELGCDAVDVANSVHAHPTLSELLMEAANSVAISCCGE